MANTQKPCRRTGTAGISAAGTATRASPASATCWETNIRTASSATKLSLPTLARSATQSLESIPRWVKAGERSKINLISHPFNRTWATKTNTGMKRASCAICAASRWSTNSSDRSLIRFTAATATTRNSRRAATAAVKSSVPVSVRFITPMTFESKFPIDTAANQNAKKLSFPRTRFASKSASGLADARSD